MAFHYFGIMDEPPLSGRRFDSFEPERYDCISVNDELIDSIIDRLTDIDTYSHSVDIPIKGLNECGITLIPPDSAEQFVNAMVGENDLAEPAYLFHTAKKQNKFIIHFGI